MGRKAIVLNNEQIEFVNHFLSTTSHGRKMDLVKEFESRFKLKYSYKTLLKWYNSSDAGKSEYKTSEQKRERNRMKHRKYYKLNAVRIRNERKFSYRHNIQRILSFRKSKYDKDFNYRKRVQNSSIKYYEVNKRRRLESFKIAYEGTKKLRLLKAKIKNSSNFKINCLLRKF
jgi:hypothetical protein